MIPKVLWEYGVEDPSDPSWVLTDISWSTDPDVWEEARRELAAIIEGTEYEPEPVEPEELEEAEVPTEPEEPEQVEEPAEAFAITTTEIALITAVAVAVILGIVAFWILRKRK